MLNLEEFSKQFSSVIVWKRDTNFVYTESNFECARLLGFKTPKEMIGQTYADIRCESMIHVDTFQNQDKQVITSHASLKYIEIHQYANKKWKILYDNKSSLIDDDGVISETIGYGIDITYPFIKLVPQLSPKHLLNGSYNIVKRFTKIHLSPRQTECLFFLIREKTAKEIARIIKISHKQSKHILNSLRLSLCARLNQSLLILP